MVMFHRHVSLQEGKSHPPPLFGCKWPNYFGGTPNILGHSRLWYISRPTRVPRPSCYGLTEILNLLDVPSLAEGCHRGMWSDVAHWFGLGGDLLSSLHLSSIPSWLFYSQTLMLLSSSDLIILITRYPLLGFADFRTTIILECACFIIFYFCGRHRIPPDLNHLAMRRLWHCAPPMTWQLAENGDIEQEHLSRSN